MPRSVVGRAFGLRQHDPCLAVRVRREPLETVQSPRVAVRRRRRLELGEVGAARAFGERLDGLACPFAGLELGHHPLADVRRRELAHEIDDHVAAGPERARHADLGLVEHVAVCRVEHRGVDAAARRFVAHGRRREAVGEHVATRVEERGRQHHFAHVVTPAVVALEPRRILVGGFGSLGHGSTHQFADPVEMGLGPRQIVGGEVVAHQELQRGIAAPPVEARRSEVSLGRVASRLVGGPERQSVNRLAVVRRHHPPIMALLRGGRSGRLRFSPKRRTPACATAATKPPQGRPR